MVCMLKERLIILTLINWEENNKRSKTFYFCTDKLYAETVWSSPNLSIKSNAILQGCIDVEQASIFNQNKWKKFPRTRFLIPKTCEMAVCSGLTRNMVSIHL